MAFAVRARSNALLACSVAVSVCGGQAQHSPPSAAYPFAAAGRDCGPADGPATTVVLSSTPIDTLDLDRPHVRIQLWRRATDLGSRTFRGTDRPSSSSVMLCDDASSCRVAQSWRVRLQGRLADGAIVGEIEVTLPDATTRAGSFRARWMTRVIGCG